MDSTEVIVRLRGVKKSFGDHVVLDGISLDVWPGETVCILGGSGAGKSTILRLILGLIQPNGGQILVRGQDVTDTGAPISVPVGDGTLGRHG